jgi:competence protein ComEC
MPLLLGHAIASRAPIPAAWEDGLRAASCAAAAASLAAAWAGRRIHARVLAAVLLRRAEIACGMAALLSVGGALAGEADRIEVPLPVHPRAMAVTVEGRVLDAVATDAAHPAITLEASAVRVGGAASRCAETLLVRFGDDGMPPAWATPGLFVRFAGRFRPPEDARNPGSSAPGRWLARLGIGGVVDADPTSFVILADERDGGIAWGGLLRLRLARLFSRDLSEPVAALARGMAFGDRSGIAPTVRDSFRDGGTIHILSISGLHVCVLAGIVAAVAVAFRLPQGPALWLELLSLWGYVLLVGAPASAVRSAILWTAMRAGRMRGSSVRPFAAWGTAGLLIHLVVPDVLGDPGFQLSFAAVLGLLASGGLRLSVPDLPVSRGLTARALRLAGGLLSLAQQSAFAEAGTLGIQVLQFGAVPVAGLFLNLAIIPLCGAFMAAMLLQLACAFLLPPLEQAAAGAVEISGLLMLRLTSAVASAVPPLPARALPPAAAIGACLALLLLAAAVWEHARVERRAEDRRNARWCALAALLLAWAAPFLPAPRTPERSSWILMLDVGQGDATLAHTSEGSILVDAGPSTETRDEGRSSVEPALRAEGITRLDGAILSHAHRDHYGGLGWLAGRGFLRDLYENGSDGQGAWRAAIRSGLRRAGARDLPVRADTIVSVGGKIPVRLLRADERGSAAARPGNARENNRSLVAFLDLDGATVCFAGDVEHDAETELLAHAGARVAMGAVRVMKVPHHGSRTSSDSAWIAAMRPRIALVSCGEGNRFGHPDRATVGRYLRSGARVYRTDQEGAIRVTLTPEGAWVSTRAHPAPELVRWRGESAVTPSGYLP